MGVERHAADAGGGCHVGHARIGIAPECGDRGLDDRGDVALGVGASGSRRGGIHGWRLSDNPNTSV